MEFLKEYNFTDDEIMEIENNNHNMVVDYFIHNKENVISVIDYFKNIGIVLNKDMFKYRLDIFSRNIDSIREVISMYNVEVLVKLINDDIINLELLD